MNQYFVEMTDTYGGEANYAWVNRFLVSASSVRGAISKVTKKTGYYARKDYDMGETVCYRSPGHCIVYFVTYANGTDALYIIHK